METWDTLEIQEKINTLKSLVKNLQFTKYNVQQELAAELSLEEPNQNIIDGYSQHLLDILAKEDYYKNEINILEGIE
jgi:uncharacterized protein YbgA (DUF1722 family)